jgi:hypothetical protein
MAATRMNAVPMQSWITPQGTIFGHVEVLYSSKHAFHALEVLKGDTGVCKQCAHRLPYVAGSPYKPVKCGRQMAWKARSNARTVIGIG